MRGFSSKASPPLSPPPEIVPLAGLAGYEIGPSLSPDGNQVAFTEINGRQNSGIYTSLVGSEQSLRLTRDRGDCCVTWSPDGREIAFLRRRDDHFDVYAASALGGAERKLYTTPRILYPSLDWSPDGKYLAFPQSSPANPSSSITLLSLLDSSTRRLTLPPSEYLDRNPSFSPDGTQLAFIRGTLAGVANDIYVVSISGGDARRLTFENRPMSGVAWATDCGSELIYSSNHGGAASLWRVPVTGGTPSPVAYAGMTAYSPSVARKGKQLAYQQAIGKNNVWRIRVHDGRKLPGRASIAIAAKGLKLRPSFSPDGKRIAFESDRLGAMEIWSCDSNGIKCAQVTSLRGTAGTARWSPDGKWIAFEFHPGEHTQIYLADADGGVARPFVAIPGQDNLAPSWSRDGQWLYFSIKRGSEPFQLWKISIHGGNAIPVTKNGGIAAAESADQRYLYFSKYETTGIWRMPRNGGPEVRVLDMPDGTEWFNWVLARKGIYLLNTTKDSGTTIDFFDLTSAKVNHVWSLDKPWGWGLALSPDNQSLLFVQSEFEESNIMVVKNFR
jgi:Tol biopolymer transport system component